MYEYTTLSIIYTHNERSNRVLQELRTTPRIQIQNMPKRAGENRQLRM